MKLTQGSELVQNDSANVGSVHSSGGAVSRDYFSIYSHLIFVLRFIWYKLYFGVLSSIIFQKQFQFLSNMYSYAVTVYIVYLTFENYILQDYIPWLSKLLLYCIHLGVRDRSVNLFAPSWLWSICMFVPVTWTAHAVESHCDRFGLVQPSVPLESIFNSKQQFGCENIWNSNIKNVK